MLATPAKGGLHPPWPALRRRTLPRVDEHETLNGLASLLERSVDRYRRMTERGLRVEVSASVTRADAVRALAQALADAAQGIEQRADAGEPDWHLLPDVGPLAVGDQLAVTADDLFAAYLALPAAGPAAGATTAEPAGSATASRSAIPVWARSGRRPAGEVLAEARAAADRLARTA